MQRWHHIVGVGMAAVIGNWVAVLLWQRVTAKEWWWLPAGFVAWSIPIWVSSSIVCNESRLRHFACVRQIYLLALAYALASGTMLTSTHKIPEGTQGTFWLVLWYALLAPMTAIIGASASMSYRQRTRLGPIISRGRMLVRLVISVVAFVAMRYAALFAALLGGAQYGVEWQVQWWYRITMLSLWGVGVPLGGGALGWLSPLPLGHTASLSLGLALTTELGALLDGGIAACSGAVAVLCAVLWVHYKWFRSQVRQLSV
jgi:hypothetical protein